MTKAPRRPARLWPRSTRGARHRWLRWHRRLALTASIVLAAGPLAAEITAARYSEPTTRYPHGVLGDAIEHGALVLTEATKGQITIRLPESRVFEDTEPRVVDVTGDGRPEVVVVESDNRLGARLAIYGVEGLLVATPFIGRSFRWLAPAAIADLDGDGAIEIAYVDRPHLAKTLRVWRYRDGALTEIATLAGVTNHRIGERDIAGGLRECGDGPEILVADAQWRNVLALTLTGDGLQARELGPHKDRTTFAAALACRPL